MRFKRIYIENYKNLKDFSIDFYDPEYIDIFVGKNGSGKSNLIEAIVEIFRNIYGNKEALEVGFNYKISYEIEGKETSIEWRDGLFYIDESSAGKKQVGSVDLPENVIVYYSGHNETIVNAVKDSEESFRKKIKSATSTDSRKFIGIGPEYKSLLLATLLLQPESNPARSYILEKLGVRSTSQNVVLNIKRPQFAESRLKELGYSAIEDFDPRTHYWGAEGITREFLERVSGCVKGAFSHSDIYRRDADQYSIRIDVDLFREEFSDADACEQFRLIDNLKTLGMLSSIDLKLTLFNNEEAFLNNLSDGQVQSVYIFSVAELFKDRHCITLLDEPDSFLHPEWQFGFLGQVFSIANEASKLNHIIMSSHSASTISSAKEDTIRLFEFFGSKVVAVNAKKSEVIKSLSSGLISFSEGEARLNINHSIKDSTKPVLFTEGITDEIIIETAWRKLHGKKDMPFLVQNAFDKTFLKNLFSRDELRENFPDRLMFALFDFDEAYDDWNGLKPSHSFNEEADPFKGLAKRLNFQNHYALLLPVPEHEDIRRQVLDSSGRPWGSGSNSHLSIELMFYSEDYVGEWFAVKEAPGGGRLIEFKGKKSKFANNFVPGLAPEHFESFRPLFEFIESKCEVFEVA
ncbi:AAA family ATPase [Halomonas sp. G15]|uniref:AAA family ATPase n=1 Tax=Halomonas sp. G15 TaxID=2903521 RepID=UPI001E5A36A3|nr:AAA family ATPase [Halomonas sp. G15]MCE0734373.1 AAA family ATPase [Halomonas sp. G15]